MSNRVIVREDDADLAHLVNELLTDEGYIVTTVLEIEELLREAGRLSPCVALIDSSGGAAFDLWWLGPRLQALGVPALAFTAHASAKEEYARDHHDFAGVIGKPFDADEFVEIVNQICWDEHHEAVS